MSKGARAYYTPAEIAKILGADPHHLRLLARAGGLPFPCVVIGSRTKFPKEAFDRFMRGDGGCAK